MDTFDEFSLLPDAMLDAIDNTGDLTSDFTPDFQADTLDYNPNTFAPEHPDADIVHSAGQFYFEDSSFDSTLTDYASAESDVHEHMASSPEAAAQVSFGTAYSKAEYLEKAENCFKEAKTYYDKAARAEKDFDREHYLREAKKWEARGKEFENKAKYA